MSEHIEMPFACSIRRPVIVLPASAANWSAERRAVVLLHELAHIRRRDLMGHAIGRFACAMYWFHPMVWNAAKQLRAESERACDDLVLNAGARPSDYAHHLLDIVTNVRRSGAPATAVPMANKREFEGRMLAILDPTAARSAPRRIQRPLLGVALFTMSLFVAAAAPVQRVAETSPSMTVTPVASASLADSSVARTTSIQLSESTAAVRRDQAVNRSIRVDTISRLSAELVRVLATPRPQAATPEPDTAFLGPILRSDQSAEVRRSTAWLLHGHPGGVPLLLDRLKNYASWRVREMAAWGLEGAAANGVSSALAAALRDDQNPYVRGTAAWALGFSQGREVDALEGALDDATFDVRRKALWALGRSGLKAAPPKAVEQLQSQHANVRAMAAWALTEIAERSWLPSIREAFLTERDPEAFRLEFRALVLMGDRSKEVIERGLASRDAAVRGYAVRLAAGERSVLWMHPLPWPDVRVIP
jgi:hypothetical protein